MKIIKTIILFSLLFAIRIQVEGSLQQRGKCLETQGRTERSNYYADNIPTRMYYTVYVPPCYDLSEQSYPVLYLMHGSNEDDNHWIRLGLVDILDKGISEGTYAPVVVVMPFGNWIANENRFGDSSWADVFLNQLMPLVESSYRINTNRSNRAIGGISRGGFWAYQIGLKNPAMFSAIGGHSAFFDPYHAPHEENPLDLILSIPNAESLRLWLDRGKDDYAAPNLDLMSERMEERNLSYTYMIYPEGQHNNDYWRSHVETYLDFYLEQWRDDPSFVFVSTPQPETTAQVIPTPDFSVSEDTSDGWFVLLPVVAFPSLQASISQDRLNAIKDGQLDPSLILSTSVASTLQNLGVSLAPNTNIVPDDVLQNALGRNRELFTLLPFNALNLKYRILHVGDMNPLSQDLNTFPFAFLTNTPNYDPNKLTRILMSGVTALTRETITALDTNGIEWASEAIAPYVTESDYFHISNEVSIYPTCPDSTETLLGSFCSKPEHFDLLSALDVDIVELSGNHNNDYGYDAYLQTLEWYKDHDMMTIGGGRTLQDARQPLILNHHGNSIAMLACNWVGPYYALVNEDPNLLGGVRPGAASCDLEWLRDVLPRLAAENDLLIVTVQYFEYDDYAPTEAQQRDFALLAELGADVVIGTQAHFPQTFSFIPKGGEEEAFIHYGLGNFFFDQEFFGGVRFFMDQLLIYDGKLLTVDLITGVIEDQGRPRPMTEDEQRNFLYMIFIQYGGF